MRKDRLEKHRKAEKRENPDAFFQWINSNCRCAVSHEKLRSLTEGKHEKIKEIVEESQCP
jgi:hypothetical protein